MDFFYFSLLVSYSSSTLSFFLCLYDLLTSSLVILLMSLGGETRQIDTTDRQTAFLFVFCVSAHTPTPTCKWATDRCCFCRIPRASTRMYKARDYIYDVTQINKLNLQSSYFYLLLWNIYGHRCTSHIKINHNLLQALCSYLSYLSIEWLTDGWWCW